MKYKFEQFFHEGNYQSKIEIEPSEIILGKDVLDSIDKKELSMHITLKTDTVDYVHHLTGIPYTDTWEDDDLPELVEQKLLEFIVE